MEPADRLIKQGNRFRPGVSGNPKGRLPGIPNRATTLVQKALDRNAGKIVAAILKQALKGDVAALRLCIDRLITPVRERSIQFPIAAPTTAMDIVDALRKIFGASTSGGLTPGEAQTLAALLEAQRKAIETATLEARVTAVENALDKKGAPEPEGIWLDKPSG